MLQLINRKAIRDAVLSSRGCRRARSGALRRALRGDGDRARVAGGGRDRERPAVRGHRAAVRGIRHRRGHGDRIARSDDVGSLGTRRDDDRRARRGGRSRCRRARIATCRFTREQLRELRYAGLLHDFGKVGVREQVLVKEKKLYPQDLELIRHRFAYLDQRTELEFERGARRAAAGSTVAARYEAAVASARVRAAQARARSSPASSTRSCRRTSRRCSPEGSFEALEAIGRRTFVDFDGDERPLLEDHELQFLMIRKGNLDEQERREIESHVTHTYRFLEQIPVDARAARDPAHRLRASREAERPRLSEPRHRHRDPGADAHDDDRRHLRRADGDRSAVQARRAARARARHPAAWKRARA